ncbi:Fic family protein [Lentisphaerota bacterium ZTH]|nr:Fic family protein [Lentisphaerota bacterium]WET05843.1 Fic family protein [Lentisphaerota bacterium ZTH]
MDNVLSSLPLQVNVETPAVLKKLSSAHRYLAELKGIAETIPNETILINTLALQEAKDSSEIENIITTHDELYKEELFSATIRNPASKEVSRYVHAIKKGFSLIKEKNQLTSDNILEIHRALDEESPGFRQRPGTALKNQATGIIVYTPPQDYTEIIALMANLEAYTNDDSLSSLDPLIKMAIIHHRFESIHPFYDGNGRVGRIINILYLITKGLQKLPILYLSRFIIRHKMQYYSLLQAVRKENAWEKWILFMLEGVEQTSKQTIWIIKQINELMHFCRERLKIEHKKIYSHELLTNLFSHPYTKIELVQNDLKVSRITAMKYLNELSESGIVEKHKAGKYNYYINSPLYDLFLNIPDDPEL